MRGIDSPHNILVLYSVVESMSRGVAGELAPDLETAGIAASIHAALAGTEAAVTSHAVRAVGDVERILGQFDPSDTLVFNLCEALDNDTSAGEVRAAEQIEKCGFCHTGSNPLTLERCLDKGRSHDLLGRSGVATAQWQLIGSTKESAEENGFELTVPFPAIVKPGREHCSLAIAPESVVDTADALWRRVDHIIMTYHQPALVERFLAGREFSVSIWGYEDPQVVGTGEIDFSTCTEPRKRIETYESKWSDQFKGVYPAPVAAADRVRLERLGLAAYRALSCTGYGRVDIREDAGELYVLEVNPNPSLAPDAGFARAAEASGICYHMMAQHLVELAWKNWLQEQ